jgi:hypothetical protein
MTSCASPRTEVRSEDLSIIVSEGSKDSRKSSQSSGSSMLSHNQLMLLGNNTTLKMMLGIDHTLRMLVFHGVGIEYP